jgi:hypothetical protein
MGQVRLRDLPRSGPGKRSRSSRLIKGSSAQAGDLEMICTEVGLWSTVGSSNALDMGELAVMC